MPREVLIAGVLAAGICVPVSSQTGGPPTDVSASVGSLPCTPIGVEGPMPWGVPPWGADVPPPIGVPALTIVVTDVRPDRARLYLDDRFIGRADDFDGRPDVLYLEPGTYVLEARLGGYRGERFELVAHEEGCRIEIRQWLERIRDIRAERTDDGPPSPFPLERVFAPAVAELAERPMVSASSGTPDDVTVTRRADARIDTEPPAVRATLRLQLVPSSAVLSIDGQRVADGDELARLRGGLAVAAGSRVLEVTAPGHRTERIVLELGAGSVVERQIRLSPLAATDDQRD